MEEGCLSLPGDPRRRRAADPRPGPRARRARRADRDRGVRARGAGHPARDRPPRRRADPRPHLARSAQGSDADAARGQRRLAAPIAQPPRAHRLPRDQRVRRGRARAPGRIAAPPRSWSSRARPPPGPRETADPAAGGARRRGARDRARPARVRQRRRRSRPHRRGGGPTWSVVCAFGALIKEAAAVGAPDAQRPSLAAAALARRRADRAGDHGGGLAPPACRSWSSRRAWTAGRCAWRRASRSGPTTPTERSPRGCSAIGGELLVRALDESPPCAEQDDALATYADKITPADRQLDPGRPRGRARADRARTDAAHRRLRRARRTEPPLGVREAQGRAAAGRRGGEIPPGAVSFDGPLPVLGCADGDARARRRAASGQAADARRGLPARAPMSHAGRGQAPRRLPGSSLRVHRRSQGLRAGGLRRPSARGRGARRSIRATGRSRWRSPTAPSSAARRWITSPQRLSSRPLERLDPPVLAALRLGLFQLLYLGGVADHAAVDETVELAKRARPAAAGLVNAVLRRGAAEGPRDPRRARRRRPRAAPRSCTRSRSGWRGCGGTELGAGRRARAAAARQRAGRVGDPRQHARWRRRRGGAAPAGARRTPRRDLPEGLVARGRIRRAGLRPLERRARSCRSRGARCWWRGRSRRSPGSACSTCAPHPAARRRTSPR